MGERAAIRLLFPLVASRLGYAYALAGRVAEGISLLEQAVERAIASRRRVDQSAHVAWLSEACLLGGQSERATALAQEALALARHCQERGYEAWALRLCGEIAVHGDPPDVDQAEAHYQRALTLAEELGMRPLVAHCHLGLGTLYRNVGRDDEAQAELATAAEMYRTMEMTFWLEKAGAVLAQVAH